jgi:hypothetical protein
MQHTSSKTRGVRIALACACLCIAFNVPAQQAAKPSAAKPSTSKQAAASKRTPAPAVPAAAAPVALSPEQLGIAQVVTTGRINCADGKSVSITPDAKIQGAFDLSFAGVKYDVTPKPTTTGAVRLEDPKSGIVFMQLANKSMLFNEKQSRRLADDCITPEQQAVADRMLSNPTVGVLDAPAK